MAVVIGLFLVTLLNAQLSRRTGTIEGVITDEGGLPLPGVNITVEGPSLQGESHGRRADGTPWPAASPGHFYSDSNSRDFRLLKRRAGRPCRRLMTQFPMKPAAFRSRSRSWAIPGRTSHQQNDLILTPPRWREFPNRNVFAAIAMAPGACRWQCGGTSSEFIVHGGTDLPNIDVDGVNVNWPVDYGIWFGEIGYDSMQRRS
jgi:hypothetical protein